MNSEKKSKVDLPSRDRGVGVALRRIATFMRTHISSIVWCLYILAGMGICVVLAWRKQWSLLVAVPALFLLPATGFLLLKRIRNLASQTENLRDDNKQKVTDLDKLKRAAGDYPQQAEELRNQKREADKQLERERDAVKELSNRHEETKARIAALELELDLKAGLQRHDIELTNQEVAAGGIHLFIKVPSPPKEALQYMAREDFRFVRQHDYVSDSVEGLVKWLKDGEIKWAFGNSSPGDILCIKREDIPPEHDVFFVGDIHGDYRALRRIVEHIDQVDPAAILVFMGDLFDRGAEEMDAVCFFLSLIKLRPGKILWLVGNHDAALKYQDDSFISSVSPASFFERLNKNPEWREFGQELIRLIETLPVAAIFPDGLWVSHGAVPHSDVLNEITDLSKLPARARTDCVNARLVDQMKKIPNRGSSTHDVGYENVIGFAEIISKIAGIEIRQLLCGHQHAVTDGAGIAQYRKYFKNVLCHGLYTSSESPVGAGSVYPCIAKYRPDKALEIVPFDVCTK